MSAWSGPVLAAAVQRAECTIGAVLEQQVSFSPQRCGSRKLVLRMCLDMLQHMGATGHSRLACQCLPRRAGG